MVYRYIIAYIWWMGYYQSALLDLVISKKYREVHNLWDHHICFYAAGALMEKAWALVDTSWASLNMGTASRYQPDGYSWHAETCRRRWSISLYGPQALKCTQKQAGSYYSCSKIAEIWFHQLAPDNNQAATSRPTAVSKFSSGAALDRVQ